ILKSALRTSMQASHPTLCGSLRSLAFAAPIQSLVAIQHVRSMITTILRFRKCETSAQKPRLIGLPIFRCTGHWFLPLEKVHREIESRSRTNGRTTNQQFVGRV
ncbi:hypothetical protein HAX54_034681, partial [Datura stramonium]|nr:hypothetical protein [Datura stramonium]